MIEPAYWRVARRFNSSAANLDELNEAYSVIGSPSRRKEYLAARNAVLGEGALPEAGRAGGCFSLPNALFLLPGAPLARGLYGWRAGWAGRAGLKPCSYAVAVSLPAGVAAAERSTAWKRPVSYFLCRTRLCRAGRPAVAGDEVFDGGDVRL